MFRSVKFFAPVIDLSLDVQEKKNTITKSNSTTFVMSLKISFFKMDVGGDSKCFFALAGGLAPLKPFSKEIALQGPLTPFSSQPSTPGKVTISTDSDYPHP
jgi:hypothetical protein